MPLRVPRVTSLYYYTSSVYLSYDCGWGIHIRLHVINSAVYIAAFDAEGVRCGLLHLALATVELYIEHSVIFKKRSMECQ